MDRMNSTPRTKSRSLAKPSQRVLTLGSPSHLRPRKPPSMAICRIISRRIVFGTDHPVGRRFHSMGSLHHPENVGFPIGDIDQAGAGHPGRGFGHPLVAFYPADALQDSWTASVCLLEFPCPHPAIHHAQRLPADSDGVGGMQKHAALSLKTEWPQPLDALTVEVEFGRVLQAQDHPMLAHAGDGASQVRRQNVLPPEALLLLAGLIEKAVGRLGLNPARAGARSAGCGSLGKSARYLDQSLGQATISECRSTKLRTHNKNHQEAHHQ
jgi:hypothetical protein